MAESKTGKILPEKASRALLRILEKRFEKNTVRHPGLKWKDVLKKLENSPGKLWSLNEMEETGGEPDVVDLGGKNGEIVFCDCSAETPKGRRSVCYDKEALMSRKEHPPEHSAVGMAEEMGIELLTEEQYCKLQEFGEFDLKTSGWLLTPPAVRTLGGAIFGDRRYNRVFVYHNGAQSYYAARAFRGILKL